MTGALALVAALTISSQIQTHPAGLDSIGPSRGRSLRSAPIMDKLYQQANKPALDLNFARFKDLHDDATGATSLVTFSRSAAQSPGTYVGSDGLIHDAAVNLQLYSEQFDNPVWTKSGVTIEANQFVSPDGKQTADEMRAKSITTSLGVYGTSAVLSPGATYNISTYFKHVNHQWIWIRGDRPSTAWQAFDIQNGIVGNAYDPGGVISNPSIQNIGNGWYRCSFNMTTTGGTSNIVYTLGNGSTPTNGPVLTLGTERMGIWGAQLEETDPATMAPTAYIKTTSQALAAPRFDHDPTTGESLGLLVEEQRTNLVASSDQVDGTTYVGGTGSTPTVTFNYGVAPDGTMTADRIQTDRGAGTGAFDASVVKAYNTTHVSGDNVMTSFYVKSLVGDAELMAYSVLGGVKSATFNINSEWQRVSFLSNTAGTTNNDVWIGSVGSYGGDQTLDFLVWGIQAEKNVTFPTSYIPTEGSAQTRYADVAAVQDEDFSTTNLISYSESFDAGGWGYGAATVLANQTTAPDGQITADLVTTTSTLNAGRVSTFLAVTPQDYVASFYAKKGSKNFVYVRDFISTGFGFDTYFDVENCQTGTLNAGHRFSSAEDVGDGWCLFRLGITPNASRTQALQIGICDADGSTATTVGGTMYFWGASFTATEYPVEYVATGASPVTKYHFLDVDEGTLYAKFRSPTEATRGIASFDDGTANEAMALQSFYSTGAQFVVTDGGTQQVNTASSIITDDAAYVGVAGYKLNDFAVATAGDVAIDIAGTIPTVDRLRIGANQGGDYLNGHIERIAYWPVRQTNSTLDVISEPVANDSYQILVKTDNTGTSSSTQFTIPAAAGTYDVDWGDGTTSTGLTGNQTHTYPTAGQYVIRMDGIERYYTNNGGDKLKLLDVQNWGDEAWSSMLSSYFGASNMIMSATDAPDLSGVTNMSSIFLAASSFNQSVNHWDVSSVTNMSNMFRDATAFNQPLNSWDTSSVTNMQAMFQNSSAFNQPIGDWDVSNVTNMLTMFYLNSAFNQPLNSWDTSNVTVMQSMFFGATSFNQPIDNWDVSSVNNIRFMFRNAFAFNQPIGSWNVGTVINFQDVMLGKSPANYDAANLDAIYNGWINYELITGQIAGFGTIKYTAAGAEGKALLTRANATVAVSNAADNGSGLVRLTTAAHGLSTGNKVYIKDIAGTTEANGLWTITVVDATTLDLQGSAFTNAYASGGTVRTGYGWTITDGGI